MASASSGERKHPNHHEDAQSMKGSPKGTPVKGSEKALASQKGASLENSAKAPKHPARKTPRVAGPDLRGMRTCLGCRGRFLREDLVRVVCDPEGHLFVDRALKAPGRGAHVCYSAACIEEACKRKAFSRAFKCFIAPTDPRTLCAAVRASVEARILDLLAIGRRAAQTLSGMDVLERQLPRLHGLVIATDAAPATVEKLKRQAEEFNFPVWRFGESESLGQTQGKPMRVAIGVTDADLAGRLAIEFKRCDRVAVAT